MFGVKRLRKSDDYEERKKKKKGKISEEMIFNPDNSRVLPGIDFYFL